MGRTDADRWLFIAFTIKDKLIWVISARGMNRKEARRYAEKTKKHPDL
ncbi:MAG: hypothetical protein L0332_22295 [Chloroflexi bacterium]|nr:hypothetical protein [Chloroflexota bacterium]MCI0648989.1 hypothetical protein [Chloroflexota bacterium]MCI0729424.1 hypothetical protein [Chloroflexota bacterium]